MDIHIVRREDSLPSWADREQPALFLHETMRRYQDTVEDIHRAKPGFQEGFTYNWLNGSNTELRACFARPCLLIGSCPGAIKPALPNEAP